MSEAHISRAAHIALCSAALLVFSLAVYPFGLSLKAFALPDMHFPVQTAIAWFRFSTAVVVGYSVVYFGQSRLGWCLFGVGIILITATTPFQFSSDKFRLLGLSVDKAAILGALYFVVPAGLRDIGFLFLFCGLISIARRIPPTITSDLIQDSKLFGCRRNAAILIVNVAISTVLIFVATAVAGIRYFDNAVPEPSVIEPPRPSPGSFSSNRQPSRTPRSFQPTRIETHTSGLIRKSVGNIILATFLVCSFASLLGSIIIAKRAVRLDDPCLLRLAAFLAIFGGALHGILAGSPALIAGVLALRRLPAFRDLEPRTPH